VMVRVVIDGGSGDNLCWWSMTVMVMIVMVVMITDWSHSIT
jgi:hypothetical protein